MSINKYYKKLPDTPGVYFFYNSKNELIYVGKATSLKNRVRSYFRDQRTRRPIEQMIHEVMYIRCKKTDSVLEAIILEANNIRKLKPKYNVVGIDDKSWNYLGITDEIYPRVVTYRQHQVESLISGQLDKVARGRLGLLHIFGPYPGLNTKATMKLLRKLFFISTCRPAKVVPGKKELSTGFARIFNYKKKPCLYRQMGQCLGVCIGEISSTEYKKRVIRPLVSFLKGGKKQLISMLNSRMKEASKRQEYEEAARLRNQIASLERIHDIALLNKSLIDNEQFMMNKKQVFRIEGYDISNLGSSGKVGSMVVFDSAGPVKSEYRKFKINTVVGQNDVDCLEEVLMRRFSRAGKKVLVDSDTLIRDDIDIIYSSIRHDLKESVLQKQKWPSPDIVLIDGGKPQVSRTVRVLRRFSLEIPVVGIAKGYDRKKNEFVFGTHERWFVRWVSDNKEFLIRVRDEAHRFAIQYQRKLREIKKL